MACPKLMYLIDKKLLFPMKSKVRSKSFYFWRSRHLKFNFFKTVSVFENLTVVKELTQYHPPSPPPLSVGRDNFQSQILKRGDKKKNECLGGLRVSAMNICSRAYYIFSQKRLLKIKCAFESSNADLGLFQPNNQLISFVTFWFC